MDRQRAVLVPVIVSVLAWLASSPGNAHSIPTHLNITKAAVDWLLEAQPRLECTDAGRRALTDALLVGTEHEDDDYDPRSSLQMGRYMFHFYPKLDDRFAVLPIVAPAIPLLYPGGELFRLDLGVFKAECDSLQWGGFAKAVPGDVNCSYHALRAQNLKISNVNTWGNALNDANKPGRFSGFSEGFVKLGYLIHLVQDQSSPAHALNASHGHKPQPLDVLAFLVPKLRGQTVDLGFPDPMEVDPAGKDAVRDVPRSAWPPRQASQLVDKPAADILKAMHDKTKQGRYQREAMAQRSDRMFQQVRQRVEGRLPELIKSLGLPIGENLRENAARIVSEEVSKEAAAERKRTYEKSKQAAEEWKALGPEAVRHSASLLWRYISDARPVMGEGAAACTLKS